SGWPRFAVYAYGIAPFARIQCSAALVSRPPEKAMPTFWPTGSACRRCDMRASLPLPKIGYSSRAVLGATAPDLDAVNLDGRIEAPSLLGQGCHRHLGREPVQTRR